MKRKMMTFLNGLFSGNRLFNFSGRNSRRSTGAGSANLSITRMAKYSLSRKYRHTTDRKTFASF